MKIDDSNFIVKIKDCSTGEVFLIPRFYTYSIISRENLLIDFIPQILNEKHNIVITIDNN